jgi:hypothetical protein
MKSIGCDVAAVASVAANQKPMATGVIIFNELLAIYRDPEIPMRGRIEAAKLMLAYGSLDSALRWPRHS